MKAMTAKHVFVTILLRNLFVFYNSNLSFAFKNETIVSRRDRDLRKTGSKMHGGLKVFDRS